MHCTYKCSIANSCVKSNYIYYIYTEIHVTVVINIIDNNYYSFVRYRKYYKIIVAYYGRIENRQIKYCISVQANLGVSMRVSGSKLQFMLNQLKLAYFQLQWKSPKSISLPNYILPMPLHSTGFEKRKTCKNPSKSLPYASHCIVWYSSIYIAPLNSHRQTEALLVRLAPRKETSFKK